MSEPMPGVLARVFRRKPRPRRDYWTFDMGRMRSWGHNAFWWPREHEGERACIFGRRPTIGDVLVSEGTAYVVTECDTPRDPGDQHFVAVKKWGDASALPASNRQPSWTDGLV